MTREMKFISDTNRSDVSQSILGDSNKTQTASSVCLTAIGGYLNDFNTVTLLRSKFDKAFMADKYAGIASSKSAATSSLISCADDTILATSTPSRSTFSLISPATF